MRLGLTNEVVEKTVIRVLEFGVPAITVGIGFAIFYAALHYWGPQKQSVPDKTIPKALDNEIDDAPIRMPLKEFFREAEKYGIDFKGASHAILDLCKELRQAGSDGFLQFWGRARFQNDPLLPIPKEHWYEYEIDWVPAFDLAGPNGGIKGVGTDNFFVMSRAGIDSNRKAYFDIHVNRAQALKLVALRRVKPTTQGAEADEAAFAAAFNRAAFNRNKASREAAVLRLAQLRTDGVVIRNEAGRVHDDNLQPWLGKVDKWMHEAIDVIWQISEADSEWFKTLDVVPPARVQFAIALKNTAHVPVFVRAYNQHDFRLVRLDELLKRYREI
jgi:hypothetical protein